MVERKDVEEMFEKILSDYEYDLNHGKHVSIREKVLLKGITILKERLAEKDKELNETNTKLNRLEKYIMDKLGVTMSEIMKD